MKSFFWFIFSGTVLIFLGLIGYAMISTENHFWISLHYFLLPAASTFLLGLFTPITNASKRVVLAICVAIGISVVLLDSFNILVERETWYKRGMPDRGEWR